MSDAWSLFDRLLSRLRAGVHRTGVKRTIGRLREPGRSVTLNVQCGRHLFGMVRPVLRCGGGTVLDPFMLAELDQGELRNAALFSDAIQAHEFIRAFEMRQADARSQHLARLQPTVLARSAAYAPRPVRIGFEGEAFLGGRIFDRTALEKALEQTLPRHRRILERDDRSWLPSYIRDLDAADPIVTDSRDRPAAVDKS